MLCRCEAKVTPGRASRGNLSPDSLTHGRASRGKFTSIVRGGDGSAAKQAPGEGHRGVKLVSDDRTDAGGNACRGFPQ